MPNMKIRSVLFFRDCANIVYVFNRFSTMKSVAGVVQNSFVIMIHCVGVKWQTLISNAHRVRLFGARCACWFQQFSGLLFHMNMIAYSYCSTHLHHHFMLAHTSADMLRVHFNPMVSLFPSLPQCVTLWMVYFFVCHLLFHTCTNTFQFQHEF